MKMKNRQQGCQLRRPRPAESDVAKSAGGNEGGKSCPSLELPCQATCGQCDRESHGGLSESCASSPGLLRSPCKDSDEKLPDLTPLPLKSKLVLLRLMCLLSQSATGLRRKQCRGGRQQALGSGTHAPLAASLKVDETMRLEHKDT